MPGRIPTNLLLAAVTLLALPGGLAAAPQNPEQSQVRVEARPRVAVNPDTEIPPEAIAAMELGLDMRAIKNRPFRAEMIIEVDRKLADGNSIRRRITGLIYRDSQGRVREERSIERPANPGAPQAHIKVTVDTIVMIRDPANRMHTTLFPGMKVGFQSQGAGVTLDVHSRRTTPWTARPDQKVARVTLGYQMIDGLQCEGRQERVTFPAQTVGNPYPLEVVTDRWYSEELQINLIVKRIDPRTGETTIRLANVVVEEPPAALFEIPADYQMREANTTAIPIRQ